MAKLEESVRPRGNLAKGLGRVLIVLAGLYWMAGAFVTFEVYQGAYQGVTAAAAKAKAERDTAAETAAAIADATAAANAASAAALDAARAPGEPSQAELREAFAKSGAPGSEPATPPRTSAAPSTPPWVVASRVAALGERYRLGTLGDGKGAYEEAVKSGQIADPYALSAIAGAAAWNTAAWTLIGWTIGFAVLAAIVLVIQWVWRGFVESTKP